jgi:hypothetical protein
MPNALPLPPIARTDAELIAATVAALAASTERVRVIEPVARYLAKHRTDRPRSLPQAPFLRWRVKRVTWQPLWLLSSEQSGLPSGSIGSCQLPIDSGRQSTGLAHIADLQLEWRDGTFMPDS